MYADIRPRGSWTTDLYHWIKNIGLQMHQPLTTRYRLGAMALAKLPVS